MQIHTLPSAAAHKITITATATLLEDLIQAQDATFVMPDDLNALDIYAEDGDARHLNGQDPTGAIGLPIFASNLKQIRGKPLKTMKLIRATGMATDVVAQIEIGKTDKADA